MSLSQVSPEVLEEEKSIQKDIFRAIDDSKSIVFNAGAGAGKTYALIESLKYIINNKSEKLTYHNQQVICITYTNVATNEIKDRLGNTSLIKVSTIHERLWDLIKAYQKQLVSIHKDKLKTEISQIVSELETDVKFQAYNGIEDKDIFLRLMLENKETYYQIRDKPAAGFREGVQSFLIGYDQLMTDVRKFKALIGKLYRIDNYKTCLGLIESEENNSVTYDARFNTDRLHKMMISHDTLLDYALKIIEKYDLVMQVIIDKHPYMLVDEYQDTDKKVVKLLKLLSDYSEQIKHNLFIGYFGDTAQNIYETGVGCLLGELHPNLMSITKKYNRRSTQEVLTVINKIRNDDIEQESIYADAGGGSVEFYCGGEDDIGNFVEKYKAEWNISQDNKLHCLVLTNELVAKYNDFGDLFAKLKGTSYYKINWQNISTEFLSHDLSKLGHVPRFIYKVIDFKSKIENIKTPIIDLISKNIYEKLTLAQLKELLDDLKEISGDNVNDYLESIFEKYNNTENENFKLIIKQLFELEEYTFEGVLSYLLNLLFSNIDDNEIDNSKEKIRELLRVNLEEYLLWFDFINRSYNQEVIYHTYHGTKGEEYGNVIIIMKNNFGLQGQNKFSSFFTNYNNEDLEGDEKDKFMNTRNLLYVSCSRAIRNLRILYIDDVSKFKNGIETIFGDTHDFPEHV